MNVNISNRKTLNTKNSIGSLNSVLFNTRRTVSNIAHKMMNDKVQPSIKPHPILPKFMRSMLTPKNIVITMFLFC
jgi:hypothetical protein